MAQLFTNAKEFFTAGENLSANEAVYVSDGTGNDSGRTAGRVYKLDVTNEDRRKFVGFVAEAISSGETATVISLGRLKGFSGLTAGQILYASLSAPGEYQTVAPIVGQFSLTLGLAKNADTVLINASLGSDGELLQAGGGVGGVDFLDVDTFNEVNLGDYDVTGTVTLDDVDPIQGAKSIKLSHATAASFKKTVAVNTKFRNKNVTLSVDLNTTAASGNLTLTVRDETNATNLVVSELMQPQAANQTSVKRSVSFIVPETCASLSYKFDALSDSGKVSFIDNVVIELTQTAKMSTTIEVPVVTEWQSYTPTFQGFGTPSNIQMQWRQVGENVEIRGKFTGGTPTAVEARIGLPNNLVSAGVGKIPSIQVVGNGIIGAASTSRYKDPVMLIEPSVTYLTVGLYDYSTPQNPFVKVNANAITFSGEVLSFQAVIPCASLTATETQEVSLAQAVLKQESDSYLRITGFTAAYASTNTRIHTLSSGTTRDSIGNDVTYTDSATLGASFTINTEGIYTFNYSADLGSSASGIGFSVNSTQLTSDFQTINDVNKLNSGYDIGANNISNASTTAYLRVGDVVRVHGQGTFTAPVNQWSVLLITKQGSLKQVNVTENQKIEIPTSELRMEGASTRGSTATAIVRFDNIAKLRGDAFTVESDATLGTRITMKKKGKLDISTSLFYNSTNTTIYISKNQQTLTSVPLSNEVLGSSQVGSTGGGSLIQNISETVFVDVGDVLRISNTSNPTASTVFNKLNLSFQEQEVAVSVTNVLPQFSESDSSVRVDTANGYGSTATKIRRFSNVRDNLGSAITYADSATNGSSFTVNESGEYNIVFQDSQSGTGVVGISRNASSLITNIDSLPVTESLQFQSQATSGFATSVSWGGLLQKGDVIRAHTQGAASSTAAAARFSISKVGKPNVTGVDVTPFAKIEYEVKQFIEHLSATAVWVSNIARFQSFNVNTNNGLIQVTDDGTNGTRFNALEDCEINMSLGGISTTASAVYIRKNTATNISYSYINNTTSEPTVSANIRLLKGEYLSVHRDGAATTTVARLQIVATELRDAYQVIGGGVENTYSARIANNGTATITSQSYPFIQSVTRNSVGNVTINFVPGFFTVAPTIVPVYIAGGTGAASRLAWVIGTPTTNSAVIGTEFNGTTLADNPFDITVTRQGSDYRTPSKAIGLPQQRIAILKDVKAAATGGGTSVTSYTARIVNTLQDPTGIIVNSSSFTGTGGTNTSIILNPGTYKIEAYAPVYGGGGPVLNQTKLKLRNTTDASDAIIGTVVALATPSGDTQQIVGKLVGFVTITSQKTFEIQQRVSTGVATQGLGLATSFGDVNVFTDVTIEKIE